MSRPPPTMRYATSQQDSAAMPMRTCNNGLIDFHESVLRAQEPTPNSILMMQQLHQQQNSLSSSPSALQPPNPLSQMVQNQMMMSGMQPPLPMSTPSSLVISGPPQFLHMYGAGTYYLNSNNPVNEPVPNVSNCEDTLRPSVQDGLSTSVPEVNPADYEKNVLRRLAEFREKDYRHSPSPSSDRQDKRANNKKIEKRFADAAGGLRNSARR